VKAVAAPVMRGIKEIVRGLKWHAWAEQGVVRKSPRLADTTHRGYLCGPSAGSGIGSAQLVSHHDFAATRLRAGQ
jgi:hypothetical protein